MEIKFEPVTPVHIGSGETCTSLEFLIEKNKLYRIAVIDFLNTKDRDFLKKLEKTNFLGELVKVLEVRNFIKYEAKIKNQDIKKIEEVIEKGEPFCIRDCIKEGYFPYIPGSSIKGAIRTILLWKFLSNNPNVSSNIIRSLWKDMGNPKIKKNKIGTNLINKIFYVGNEGKRYDAKFFSAYSFSFNCSGNEGKRYDAKHDILKFLEVSDFIPKNGVKLKIINVKTYSLKRNYSLEPNKYNIFAESFEGSMTGKINLQLDGLKLALKNKEIYPQLEDKLSILGLSGNFSEKEFLEYLKNSAREFNEWCLSKEIELCKKAKDSDMFIKTLEKLKEINKKENLIRTGFGVGTIYQTLIKLIEEYDIELTKEIVNKFGLGKFKRNINRINKEELYPLYPKSIEFTEDNLPLGWLKWEEC